MRTSLIRFGRAGQVQENPSPTKKTGPAWGGAGLSAPPARPPTDKAKDNDWADECEVESGGKDRGFAAAAAPPVAACPRGIDPDIIRGGEMPERQMQQERGGVLGVADNWRGAGAYGGRGWPGDGGADGRQRAERHAVDSSVVRERWGGHNNTHTGMMRGEVKVLRRDSGGDTAAMDAVAAVATEREQLQNSDANPRKVEDGNNPAQADSADVRARPVQPQPQQQPRPVFASATHDPQDEVFRAMAVRRARVDAEVCTCVCARVALAGVLCIENRAHSLGGAARLHWARENIFVALTRADRRRRASD